MSCVWPAARHRFFRCRRPTAISAAVISRSPDGEFGGNNWDPKNCVHISRELIVADRLIEQLTLTNYLPDPIEYWVELLLAADFADIFEIRGWKREKRGQYFAPQPNRNRSGERRV